MESERSALLSGDAETDGDVHIHTRPSLDSPADSANSLPDVSLKKSNRWILFYVGPTLLLWYQVRLPIAYLCRLTIRSHFRSGFRHFLFKQ